MNATPPLLEVFCILSPDRTQVASDEFGPKLFANHEVAMVVAASKGALVEKWHIAAPELALAAENRSKIIQLPETPKGLIVPG